MTLARQLDQFFTLPSVAQECAAELRDLDLPAFSLFIEPAAGNGAMLDAIERVFPFAATLAFDIAPSREDLAQQDFFLFTLTGNRRNRTVFFTNPPFGKKANLAIQFFNKAASFADTVALIVPIQFRKWSVQSKLDSSMALIRDTALIPESFTFVGKPYSLRCAFQVWTRLDTIYSDLRLSKNPPKVHPDFQMWQYNRTPAALSVFYNDFDFAVPRQGYVDYTRKETDPDNCERKTQWILFKATNRDVLDRLLSIDFGRLAMNNTSTPGFGKGDVVAAYSKLVEKQQ